MRCERQREKVKAASNNQLRNMFVLTKMLLSEYMPLVSCGNSSFALSSDCRQRVAHDIHARRYIEFQDFFRSLHVTAADLSDGGNWSGLVVVGHGKYKEIAAAASAASAQLAVFPPTRHTPRSCLAFWGRRTMMMTSHLTLLYCSLHPSFCEGHSEK
jgi:hypothetical protein